jgi:hypothetical protein
MLQRAYFDKEGAGDAVEIVKLYQREWDDDKKMFRDAPRHDFTSHAADSLRMMAIAWREDAVAVKPPEPKFPTQQTLNELIKAQTRKRLSDD